MLTPRGKKSTGASEEVRTHNAASRRTAISSTLPTELSGLKIIVRHPPALETLVYAIIKQVLNYFAISSYMSHIFLRHSQIDESIFHTALLTARD